jgi:thymidylate kinase
MEKTRMHSDTQLSPEDSSQFAQLLRYAQHLREHDERIRWTDSNGIPLCFLDDKALDESSITSEWKAAKELALNMLPREKLTWPMEYRAASQALEAQGIQMCLTKTYGPFPFWSGNIDSIVLEKDIRDAARTLESVGFVRLPWADEPHKLLFKRFKGGRPVISLHLHSRIAWDATYIHGEDAIRNNRLIDVDSKIRTINDGALVAAILAHAFIENRSVRLNDLLIVGETTKRSGAAIDEAAKIAKGMGWGREFSLAVAAFLEADDALKRSSGAGLLSDLPGIANAPREDVLAKSIRRRIRRAHSFPITLPLPPTKGLLMKRIYARDEMPGYDTGLSRVRFFLGNYAARRLGSNFVKGGIIAISGPDGSGKSTVARGVSDLAREMGVDFRVYWSRYGFVSKAFKGRGAEKSEEGSTGGGREQRVTKRSRLKLADNIARLAGKSLMTRMSGNNIIFDRHFIDTKVDFQIETGDTGNRLVRLGDSLIMEPDLRLILIADPETLASRSGEDLAHSAVKAKVYSSLIQVNKDNVLILDAAKPLGDTLDRIAPMFAASLSKGRGGRGMT